VGPHCSIVFGTTNKAGTFWKSGGKPIRCRRKNRRNAFVDWFCLRFSFGRDARTHSQRTGFGIVLNLPKASKSRTLKLRERRFLNAALRKFAIERGSALRFNYYVLAVHSRHLGVWYSPARERLVVEV
jgi:hypothetical protein